MSYNNSASCVLESLDGQSVAQSRCLKDFHEFGDVVLPLWDRLFDVQREAILER